MIQLCDVYAYYGWRVVIMKYVRNNVELFHDYEHTCLRDDYLEMKVWFRSV